MPKVRGRGRKKTRPKAKRGRKPVFTPDQKRMIEKVCEQTVRRETTPKGRPALSNRQRAAVKKIVGEVLGAALKTIGRIDVKPPVKRRRRKKRGA